MRASLQPLLAFVLLVVPVVSPLACGGKTSDGGPPTVGAVPREQFVDAYVHAVCDNAGTCCLSNGFGHDAASCVAQAKAEFSALLASTKLARAHYDADAAGRCIAAARTASASCAPHGIDGRACDSVFFGDGAPGTECKTTLDCAPPPAGTAGRGACEFISTSDGSGTTTSAHCIVLLEPREGASCGGGAADVSPRSDCSADGWYCDGSSSSSSGTCHARKAIGEACAMHGGPACVDGATCTGGVCVGGRPVGAACTGFECAAGARCDYAGSHTCVAMLPVGAPCETGSTCASGICSKTKCVSSVLAEAPICVAG